VAERFCSLFDSTYLPEEAPFFESVLSRCSKPEIEWIKIFLSDGYLPGIDWFLSQFSFEKVFQKTFQMWDLADTSTLDHLWSKRTCTTIDEDIRLLQMAEQIVTPPYSTNQKMVIGFWIENELRRIKPTKQRRIS
jgi:hypothetical protein